MQLIISKVTKVKDKTPSQLCPNQQKIYKFKKPPPLSSWDSWRLQHVHACIQCASKCSGCDPEREDLTRARPTDSEVQNFTQSHNNII